MERTKEELAYIEGQARLIQHIQSELEKAVSEFDNKNNSENLFLDVLSILQKLKPIPKEK